MYNRKCLRCRYTCYYSLKARFVNSIFWGQGSLIEDEVKVLKESNTEFDVEFENCIWKIKKQPEYGIFSNMLNSDPLFDSINISEQYYNFRLKPESPAIDAGKPLILPVDITGKTRGATPDIGAYEKE